METGSSSSSLTFTHTGCSVDTARIIVELWTAEASQLRACSPDSVSRCSSRPQRNYTVYHYSIKKLEFEYSHHLIYTNFRLWIWRSKHFSSFLTTLAYTDQKSPLLSSPLLSSPLLSLCICLLFTGRERNRRSVCADFSPSRIERWDSSKLHKSLCVCVCVCVLPLWS